MYLINEHKSYYLKSKLIGGLPVTVDGGIAFGLAKMLNILYFLCFISALFDEIRGLYIMTVFL